MICCKYSILHYICQYYTKHLKNDLDKALLEPHLNPCPIPYSRHCEHAPSSCAVISVSPHYNKKRDKPYWPVPQRDPSINPHPQKLRKGEKGASTFDEHDPSAPLIPEEDELLPYQTHREIHTLLQQHPGDQCIRPLRRYPSEPS